MQPSRWPSAVRLPLAGVAGGITVLGFAPFGIGVVAVLALGLLIWLWKTASSAPAGAALGFAFGLGLMGFGVSWIRISIAQFGGVHEALAVTITLGFVILMASYFALVGWLVVRLRGRGSSLWLLLTVPAVWVLIEWLRGWLFTGFPWLAMGYTQIDLPLKGFAPLLGIYGVSGLVVLSAALLNVTARLRAAAALGVLWIAGLALQQQAWTSPAGEPIKVSLLQASIPQSQKWLPEMRAPTLAAYLSMTRQVADSQIVVWPETAVPAFDTAVEESLLAPLHEQLRAEGRDLILGIVAAGEGDDYYNAMLSLGVSGRDHYYKRHLVPFGEYLPLERWLRPILDFIEIPMSNFARGDGSKPLVTLAGQPVGIDICYEDAYAEEIIRALPEATLLINASNDAWFGDSLAPHQHLEIARMRAVETGRYLLRATNTGISAIIAPDGQLLGVTPQFEPSVLTDEVTPRQGMTPFARWGHGGAVVLSLLLLSLGLWRSYRGSSSAT
ncbi:MAG: apolipoprotein N-acyltransferase [Chromatiaceae bacterium]